ncbi:hypothetical protein ACSLBF_17265 [Pseudoalteromonas sp. T1lg65]|uniref:hypothetical protein n=1 Tax=Pseudoalteromonas sp. T1lg65 TaxID=2077101 RepID=UPI003F7AB3A8
MKLSLKKKKLKKLNNQDLAKVYGMGQGTVGSVVSNNSKLCNDTGTYDDTTKDQTKM